MGYLSEFLLNVLDPQQGWAFQILSEHPFGSYGLLPHYHGPLRPLFLLVLKVLLLSAVLTLRVLVLFVAEVLKILLICVIIRGIIGVEHVDEFVGTAQGRYGVEGAFVFVHGRQDQGLGVEELQLAIGLIEVEPHRRLPRQPQLPVRRPHQCLQRPVLDLQHWEVLHVNLDEFMLIGGREVPEETAGVLGVEFKEEGLVVEVGLLELVAGVAAPVHRLLIDGDVHQVLVEFHHHHLVVLGVLVEEEPDLASGSHARPVDLLPQGVLEAVEFHLVP
jgi:hypothetical protein